MILWGGGGQIFVKRFAVLVSVYKNTHTGLKCLNANYVMPHSCRGGGEAFIKIQNFIFIFDDLHLQIIASISPKTSVENSSAQWAIFLPVILVHNYTQMLYWFALLHYN